MPSRTRVRTFKIYEDEDNILKYPMRTRIRTAHAVSPREDNLNTNNALVSIDRSMITVSQVF